MNRKSSNNATLCIHCGAVMITCHKRKCVIGASTLESISYTCLKYTWQILKKALGKVNLKANFPQTFSMDKKQISNKAPIDKSFNNYFPNIAKVTRLNVPQSNNNT